MASRPAFVIFRAKRPSSFSCQTGASALARISRARPLLMREEATFMAAVAFKLAGRGARPSSCFAADESTISCVSVSLVMVGTFVGLVNSQGFHGPKPLLRKTARGDNDD